jgi:hypothetical protein
MFDDMVEETNTQQESTGLQWMITGTNRYQACGQTLPKLPTGAYTCLVDNCWNPVYQGRDLQVDDLIDFPDSLPSRILKEIARFWTTGERFARLGFLHRRGYLFYGKQGGGKSSLIHQVVAKILAAGHVAFFCDRPDFFIRCLERFREVEPDRPVVCVFEDIDALIARFGDSELLQWLDGNHQVNKAVNLASTNYPEKLDRRIVSRPRRFDRILRIDSPDARLRAAFLARKLPDQPPEERQLWVERTQGLTFAALAELIISVHCLENNFEETLKLLRELDLHTPSSQEFANNGVAHEPVEAGDN